MTTFLISFPAEAMNLSDAELAQADADSHAVIREAQRAGVYVFGGGIDEGVSPATVSARGQVSPGAATHLTGGFTILELRDRAEAERWAAKLAAACRCPQELREFRYDPES